MKTRYGNIPDVRITNAERTTKAATINETTRPRPMAGPFRLNACMGNAAPGSRRRGIRSLCLVARSYAVLRGDNLVRKSGSAAVASNGSELVGQGIGVPHRSRRPYRSLALQLARIVETKGEATRHSRCDVAGEKVLRLQRPAARGFEAEAMSGREMIVQVGRVKNRGAVRGKVNLAVRSEVIQCAQRGRVVEDDEHILQVGASVGVVETDGLRGAGEEIRERQIRAVRAGTAISGDMDVADGARDRSSVGVAEVGPGCTGCEPRCSAEQRNGSGEGYGFHFDTLRHLFPLVLSVPAMPPGEGHRVFRVADDDPWEVVKDAAITLLAIVRFATEWKRSGRRHSVS